MTDKLQVELIEHCALITLSNPPANTWDRDSFTQLREQVAQRSPASVAACKELIQQSRTALEKGLMRERELFVDLFDSADQQEGVSAFLPNRAPQWKNA